MTDLTFPNDLADRLQQIADRENRSIPDVVRGMLDHQYTDSADDESSDEAPIDNPLLRILEMAEAANLEFKFHDTSTRSREILETEYADYLLRRMRGEDVET